MEIFSGPFPRWSPQAESVWAKTDRDNPESGEWLNLPQHMMDSAQVCAYLWENYLSANHRQFIQDQLGLTADEAHRLVAFLCGVHDVGKATFSFVMQITKSSKTSSPYGFLLDKIRESGLPLKDLPDDEWSPHSAASLVILNNFLIQKYGSEDYRFLSHLGQILGAHHGLPATEDFEDRAETEIRGMKSSWKDLHQELLTKMLELTRAEPALEKLIEQKNQIGDSSKMILSGLIIMADWIASNTDYFPLGQYSPADQPTRFMEGIDRLRLPTAWAPEDFGRRPATDIYTDKFLWPASSSPRPVQKEVLDVLDAHSSTKMLIIEAPMGEGKTEAALVAAEKLARTNNCNGIFFGAPTMTTTDSLFSRISRWAEQSHESPVVSMYLGHSKNQLNDNYTSMDRLPRMNLDDDTEPGARTSHSQVIAHQWFRGRKQGILSSLVVATVDQVLMMALQSKHLMLRHLGLAGKVVVIDEVHSYDSYMGHYLASALRWLGNYGAPVVLLSATLPYETKAKLAEAYQKGLLGRRARRSQKLPATGASYPVITSVSAREIQTSTAEPSARSTTYRVIPLADDDSSLLQVMGRVVQDGGCLLIICDTVSRAQQAYLLAHDLVGEDAYLLHSRFTAIERVEKEGKLVEELGPASSVGRGRPQRRIVVATQVVEQSLDVDFDCMVTDIAPVDLVLQRLGRVHRHERPETDRPAWASSPRVYIRGMEELPSRDEAPVFASGVDAVYQPALLLSTCSELKLFDPEPPSIVVPGDIPLLVEAVYREEAEVPAGWEKDYRKAQEKLESDQHGAARRATPFRAQLKSVVRKNFREIWSGQEGDVTEERGAAQVRDTEPTIEVVLAQQVGDGYYAPLPWVRDEEAGERPVISQGFTPDAGTAYVLARSTVTLPYQFSREFEQVLKNLERNTDPAWQESYLLRGMLQLTLDERCEVELCGYKLRYTQELGLQLLEDKEKI